jgi:hypothetical protein
MKHVQSAHGSDSRPNRNPSHRNREHIKPSFWRRHRALWIALAAIILILAAIRAALPVLVKHYVNLQLQKSKDYAGGVGRVSISLWRGAYEVRDINIYKRNGKIRDPFFSAPYLDISLQWPALIHGHIVTTIYMQQPKLNFVLGPTPAQSQAGENTPWNEILENLVPFKLNQLVIHDGEIHYKDDYSDPKVDIYFSELGASATNLSNAKNQKLPLPAGIRANARTIGGGSMSFQLQMNPTAAAPTYQLQASLTNVDLPALNNFFRAYGKFDVAKGTFAMFTSVAATNHAFEGYTKVFFKDLDVFAWKKERQKNILKIFWETVVGTVATILKNQPHDQLAAKVPISGVYTNSTISLSVTIGTLLRNAFIQALLPWYDQKVTTDQVAQDVKQGNVPNANPNGTGNGGTSTNAPFGNQPITPAEKEHAGTLLERFQTGTNAPLAPP